MERTKGLSDWIPLIGKLVWPVITVILLLIFHNQVREVYSVVMTGIKSGRSVEIGGFLKLGEAASDTKIETLSHDGLWLCFSPEPILFTEAVKFSLFSYPCTSV